MLAIQMTSIAASRIAAAAQIDQSYSPGGANVHSYLPSGGDPGGSGGSKDPALS